MNVRIIAARITPSAACVINAVLFGKSLFGVLDDGGYPDQFVTILSVATAIFAALAIWSLIDLSLFVAGIAFALSLMSTLLSYSAMTPLGPGAEEILATVALSLSVLAGFLRRVPATA
jgi:hypothetical protein